VINFILATDVQGTEVFATTGSPSRKGGGQKTNVGITTGTGDYKKDGFNITLSLNFEKEKELYAGDRDFAKTGTLEPWIYGAATGQGNIEGAWNKSSTLLSDYGNRDGRVTGFGNSPGTGYGNPMADLGKCADIGMVADPWGTSKDMPFCYYE
jgi:iron complex outermembrane receptor protein